MTERDYYFLKAIEECGELAHALAKSSQFGLDDIYDDMMNSDRVELEYNHLIACLMKLEKFGLHLSVHSVMIEEKLDKMKEWMKYSRKKGLVE
jgi:NTP pyrophosphatase (non-canonical NTP hydrolase)